MMKAFNFPREAAYTFFEKANTDKSGKLKRNELVPLFRNFWMKLFDLQWDGVYAYKYKANLLMVEKFRYTMICNFAYYR